MLDLRRLGFGRFGNGNPVLRFGNGGVDVRDSRFQFDGLPTQVIKRLGIAGRMRVIGHVAPLIGQRCLALGQLAAFALEPFKQCRSIFFVWCLFCCFVHGAAFN